MCLVAVALSLTSQQKGDHQARRKFKVQREGKAQALALGLTGWVKNLPNGTVEVHVEGDQVALNHFIEWCRKGPPSAKVSKCDLDWVTPQGMDKFRIL